MLLAWKILKSTNANPNRISLLCCFDIDLHQALMFEVINLTQEENCQEFALSCTA